VRERILAALPGATVAVEGPSTLKVRVKPGGDRVEAMLPLDDLRLQCAKGERDCADGIEATLANLAEAQATFSQPPGGASALQRPLHPEDPESLAQVEKRWSGGRPDPQAENHRLKEPFAGDLSILYVLDMPKGMRVPVAGDLKKRESCPPEQPLGSLRPGSAEIWVALGRRV
jgi:hypothetical protein